MKNAMTYYSELDQDYFDDYQGVDDQQYSDEPTDCQLGDHVWKIVSIDGCECEECTVCGVIDC